MALWGYNQLNELLEKHPRSRIGFLIDTNILVAATYDLDKFNDEATNFLDKLVDEKVPLYCNVNIRSEFLEIHRRIIISEALLDFKNKYDKTNLDADLASELTNYKNRYERKIKNNPKDPPLRLSEREIKNFKLMMSKITDATGYDLWTEFCNTYIGTQIIDLWPEVERGFGLNFLSLRKEDQERHLNQKPEWDDMAKLMSNPSLSSSDAMILNMFLVSKFEVIASSDPDIALAMLKNKSDNKHCIIPEQLKTEITALHVNP